MHLDVYVMPLWRFKAGDFKSPVEELLGIKPTTISLSGEIADAPPPRTPWYVRVLAAVGLVEIPEAPPPPDPAEERALAVQEVDALKTELSRMTAQPVDWRDEGDVYYNKQYHARAFIRAFAAWFDHRDAMPEFLSGPPDKDEDFYPVWDLPAPARRRFPTLVKHQLYNGYFIPVPFEGVYEVEPYKIFGTWDAHREVASTHTVLREVEELLAAVAELPLTGHSPEHVKYVEAARDWADELRKICALSLEHGVPVIFYS